MAESEKGKDRRGEKGRDRKNDNNGDDDGNNGHLTQQSSSRLKNSRTHFPAGTPSWLVEEWSRRPDDCDMKLAHRVVDGIYHLSPYWTTYRSHAKGRWIGEKLVAIFEREFLAVNPRYALAALRSGRIFVNGQQMTDPDYKLADADRIVHVVHRHEHPVLDKPIKIVHEDDNLLVLDKPASWPVHPCGKYAHNTVTGRLRTEQGRVGLRILHRLDRTTSGILLLAKNYEADVKFKKRLLAGEVTKEYVARVEGVFPEGEIVCEAPIGTLIISMGIQCVREDTGKACRTVFRRLYTDGKSYSVVSARLFSGRTHQIRVHLQWLGYPIVSDTLYNRPEWGPLKGKGGDYGKSFEQLCKDVAAVHHYSEFREVIKPEYAAHLETICSAETVEPESAELPLSARPDYDPLCLGCNSTVRAPKPEHYAIELHCLRYESEEGRFETDVPEWATERNERADEHDDGDGPACEKRPRLAAADNGRQE